MNHWRGATLAVIWLALAMVGCGCSCRRQPLELNNNVPPQVTLPNRNIPVLCYHNLRDEANNLYETSVVDFRTQLTILHHAGFQTITTPELVSFFNRTCDLPEKPVLITFDDGYKSVLTVAKPILDEFGFRANIFLITDSVGGKGNLSWNDVQILTSAGWSVGSHTANHSNLTRRGKSESIQAHLERINKEMTVSYMQLEEKLGMPPVALAYPFGNYDSACVTAAQEAGYQLAFSIDPGTVDQQSDLWRLPRKMIVNGTSRASFERQLTIEPLHLVDTTPPVGQRITGRSYEFVARVTDLDTADNMGAEAGKATQVHIDPTTSLLTVTTSLNRGANLVRVFSSGSPRRETGWIVVCDP